MNFPYQIFIALRYFRSKKKHGGVSVNTVISIGGVALGVMALIIVLSVMGGFREDLQGKILGANAHVVVLNYQGKIREYDALRQDINSIEGVTGSSPVVYGQVMLGVGDRAYGVVVRGIEPDIEAETTDILNYIKEGGIDRFRESDEGIPGIIVGRELARSLGLFIGDEINMISPVGEIGPLGMLPKMKKFRLDAIFEVGMFEYDSNLALINLSDAQDFFKLQDEVTGIEIKVEDIYRSREIAREIENRLGSPYYARDWMEMNRNLFSALELEKIVMFIILILIVLVASFNIVSSLIMIVMEKAREIAVMKAMGATSRGVMSIFMIQGLIIGVVGTVIGLAGGLIGCLALKIWKFPLPADVYYLSHLPVRMGLFDFIIVPGAAIIISFLATIYPSWQAAKLDPVEPLRYE
ncbi:MAG TPA: lipoprotein-releasing ABC transporter permease subunit [Nitrospirae bacterium]|nr:lipoprotein-releasing system transmembrane protein LolC [bacterium BMS3Abin10]GBE38766.1 lipoprotein-releasing system transmembrane protein LolC [bacterium BMS3Bbin08]HDH51402.1 lipoprotein-releasing ABC transporter permease subunit [Nitrospirota bacterium]HDK41556.1 lipoprotein-releasing ABC transporter permease subunit [Nitrospirota bacterium]HDK81815.1 lipoprotein-releasing ABC transporter permease subunit [Nitrospirota bacterium]